MLLTVNISNSHITLGAYENEKHLFFAALHTDLLKTADEYAAQLSSILLLYGRCAADISGVILSCVVPSLLSCMKQTLARLYPGRIYLVGPGLKTGLAIKTDDPAQLGGELVCMAVAAHAWRTFPCLMISMDTAISMTALDSAGALRGGAIMPGVRLGAQALCAHTAQLPQVDLAAPVDNVLGTNSAASMRAGLILGTASMIDGMITRFETELGGNLTCVATGEIAPVILPHCRHAIVYEKHLVHEGLRLLYEKSQKTF